MADSFHARIPTLSDADLRRYLEQPLVYKTEAVELALAELRRRGHAIPADDLARLQRLLDTRDAARQAELEPGPDSLLGASPAARRARLRRITAGLLAAGLGAATLLYVTAKPPAATPLGYEPENTKRYLRQLEVVGGKANVVGTEFQRWFEGLWQGRQLAFTVAWLTVLLAAAFWFLSTRLAVGTPADTDADGGR
ncbi:hypothetical protein [Geothrix edaphica]|uniref:DUF1707 domain-containing protein n=1 Tax=Geothrix edaphica TaxID=2927976 RepID=A0ABQ5PXR5_9BACT|nr:hypothetical protein [Geothrix edaphica]GLH67182.1 hypothetical protein GETHED_15460 [Geothrix edaphica]